MADKPGDRFKLDKTALFTGQSRMDTVWKKGVYASRTTDDSGRVCVKFMACVSTNENVSTPIMVFSGKRLQLTWKTPVWYLEWHVISEYGLMVTKIFNSWFDPSYDIKFIFEPFL